MSPITTHVLDTALGRPAAGLPVTLDMQSGVGWNNLARGVTDPDGRIAGLLPAPNLAAGTYRLTFDTAAYFKSQKKEVFYPQVQVMFAVTDRSQHYHIPLLLSPYGYSTYRGS